MDKKRTWINISVSKSFKKQLTELAKRDRRRLSEIVRFSLERTIADAQAAAKSASTS